MKSAIVLYIVFCSWVMQARAIDAPPMHVVCYDDIFQPYFMIKDGKFTGLNVDVVAEAGRRIGVTVEFRQMPWRRLELELSGGKNSAIRCGFGFSRTATRMQNMIFGQVPVQATEYTLFVRNDMQNVTTLNDLNGKVIGARSGFRLPDAISEGMRAKRWRVDEVDSDKVNFQKLTLKRVDAVLTNRDVGLYTLRELNVDSVHPLSPSLMRFDTYMVFAKDDSLTVLANAFDGALSSMAADGTIKRLRERYLGHEAGP